ncbi:NAD(P)-dependent oxidoreductase [Candidatus Pelagibacter sp.]|jgi:nucleoside-diphosphate-sugar epimerase|nr:NAD(P)-dependent oxidoreductase [Candidatus Pelagibacter sp.]
MSEFEELKNKKIALIGGAGFIGHNLALRLQSLGASVEIIDGMQVNNLLSLIDNVDNLPYPELARSIITERTKLLKKANINLRVQDVRDYHALTRLLNVIKPQVIIQLAAVSHANRSNKDPYSTFDHSFRTLENSLDWARGGSSSVEQFIFFSSSMVYGNFQTDQVDEKTHCEPLGIYGALKYGSEKIVIGYNQTFDLPYTIIRPSALYGERCISRRVGQIFIENSLMGKEIVMSDKGQESLDFTYINDLVDGIIRCIGNKNAINQVFNLTYGKACSIANMSEIIKKHFPNIKIRNVERDKLMPKRGTLNVDKAKDLIGYNPSWPLEKGYTQYINWYKKFINENPNLIE